MSELDLLAVRCDILGLYRLNTPKLESEKQNIGYLCLKHMLQFIFLYTVFVYVELFSVKRVFGILTKRTF